MSVAENEAREEFWNEYGLQAVMLRTAYVAGRTAEPCEEQVRAATEALSEHMHEWVIDHGFDREVDNGFRCSCGVSGYTYPGLWAHLARVCLNAAREAVM